MKPASRMRWLVPMTLLGLALSVAALVRDGSNPGQVARAEPETRSNAAAPSPAGRKPKAAEHVGLDRLRAREPMREKIEDAFAPRSWRKPAPPAEGAARPPAPSAPPLPFTYIGKLLSEGSVRAFVLQEERSLILREGDTIDSTYRVEQIAEGRLTFTHLPTGTEQTLLIGALQ